MDLRPPPAGRPARAARPAPLLDPLPATARPAWGWWLGTSLGVGALAAVSSVGWVSLVAACTLSLTLTTGLACAPPGERLMRTLGWRAWAGRTSLVACVPVAALGVALVAGASGLLLWAAGLVAGWLLLVRATTAVGVR